MRVILIIYICLCMVSCTNSELVDMHQISEGARLYKSYCANCHQDDGSGLAKLIPPLKNSDYFDHRSSELPCLIKNGYKGVMKVNGIDYNLEMPFAKGLDDEEIASICVFVLQKFPAKPIPVSDSMVMNQLNLCTN